jgi:hypothetical protein
MLSCSAAGLSKLRATQSDATRIMAQFQQDFEQAAAAVSAEVRSEEGKDQSLGFEGHKDDLIRVLAQMTRKREEHARERHPGTVVRDGCASAMVAPHAAQLAL